MIDPRLNSRFRGNDKIRLTKRVLSLDDCHGLPTGKPRNDISTLN